MVRSRGLYCPRSITKNKHAFAEARFIENQTAQFGL